MNDDVCPCVDTFMIITLSIVYYLGRTSHSKLKISEYNLRFLTNWILVQYLRVLGISFISGAIKLSVSSAGLTIGSHITFALLCPTHVL